MRILNAAAPAAIAVLLLQLACHGGAPNADVPTGDIDVHLARSAQSILGAIPPPTSVWIRLTGTTASGKAVDSWTIAAAVATGGHRALLTQVPAGVYRLHGRAFVSAPLNPANVIPDYESDPAQDPSVTVVAKGSLSAALMLQQNLAVWPVKTSSNSAPTVNSLVASAISLDSSDPTNFVSLSATYSDLDGASDIQSISWTDAGAGGRFTAAGAASTNWFPPTDSSGLFPLTFTVTDKKGASAATSIWMTVGPKLGKGSVTVIASINNWPDMNGITGTNAQPAPGGSATFTANASDADSDALVYTWDDGNCGGTFNPSTGETTTYTASSGATPRSCTITATVRDYVGSTPRGGVSNGRLVINVGNVAKAYGPEFRFATQSPSNAVDSSSLGDLHYAFFEVDVAEPLVGGAYIPVQSLTWDDGTGRGAFTPMVAGNQAYVKWLAPTCNGSTVPLPLTIIATATGTTPPGAAQNKTSFKFDVLVACP